MASPGGAISADTGVSAGKPAPTAPTTMRSVIKPTGRPRSETRTAETPSRAMSAADSPNGQLGGTSIGRRMIESAKTWSRIGIAGKNPTGCTGNRNRA
jgi:hypothetical protein